MDSISAFSPILTSIFPWYKMKQDKQEKNIRKRERAEKRSADPCKSAISAQEAVARWETCFFAGLSGDAS